MDSTADSAAEEAEEDTAALETAAEEAEEATGCLGSTGEARAATSPALALGTRVAPPSGAPPPPA